MNSTAFTASRRKAFDCFAWACSMTLPTAATTPAEPEQAAPKERLRGDFSGSQPLARDCLEWCRATPAREAREECFWMRRMAKAVIAQVARHPRRLSTISGGVLTTHHRGGDVVRDLLQAGGGQGHPCLSGAKTVGDALRTLPANVASGTLMPSVSASLTWGAYPPSPPFFGFKVPNDLIRCHRPLSGRSEDFVEIVLSHPAKRSRLFLAVSLST